MRPTGGMRRKLGHEQAGLRDVLVPVRARLGIALLGLKVDVEQAIALVIAVAATTQSSRRRSRRRRLP